MKPRKPFRRALSYCKPYKRQLIVSIVLALLIGVFWMGSIATVAPVLKTMLDEHGLHGWAHTLTAQERLGFSAVVLSGNESDFVPRALIQKIDKDGALAAAGVRVGEDLLDASADTLPAGDGGFVHPQKIFETIANAPVGGRLSLRIRGTGKPRTVEVTIGQAPAHIRLLRWVVDLLPTDRLWAFACVMGTTLVITILRSACRFGQDYMVSRVSDLALVDIRNRVYRNVVHLPLLYFGRAGTAETMSRFVQDSNQLQYGVKTLFADTVREPFKAIGVLVLAFAISWQSMVMVLCLAPIGWGVIHMLGRKMRKSTKRMLSRWGRLMGIMEETLFGIRVVKAYTMEGYEQRRFEAENNALLNQQLHMHKIDTISSPLMEVLGTAVAATMMVLLSKLVFDRQMAPDQFMLFVICLVGIFDPLRKLSKVNNRIQSAAAGASRMFELLDCEPEDVEAGKPFPAPVGSIRFENVSFAYGKTPVLEEISFEVPAGATVAVVGQTGSGKTTLLSLLPRFFDPTAGRVTVNGENLRTFSLTSLRDRIGLVSQDPVLFADTIFNNIAYGHSDQSSDVVKNAAARAFADEFIDQIPTAYETMLDERGTNFSGGQKQRLALARAIARDPDILILDEATSAVDRDTEAKIQSAIAEFVKGRTTFVIAHRLSTIRHADLILVLDAGKLVAEGTHDVLMADSNLYRRLYATAFAGDETGESDAG